MMLVGLVLATALPAVADRDDHDRARGALQRGEVLPLARILSIVEEETDGRVIEVEFERDDGRWVYELELLLPDGSLVELEVDAATARILEREDAEGDDD